MTSRDLVIKTLNHEAAERVPRDLWILPGMETARADDLAEIEVRYPKDVLQPSFKYPPGTRAKGKPCRVGQYTDSWGCTWHVSRRGTTGEVTDPPLVRATEIDQYQPPLELLDETKLGKVNRECAATSRFMLAWTEARPFDRLRWLHGTEATLKDLAQDAQRIRNLLARLHEFFCRELQMWAGTDVDGIVFRDDWGSEEGLWMPPELWRDLFKPLYKEYCDIIHGGDKFVFFHSAGDISDIFSDLVKIGVDAVNSQLCAMNVERLAKRFRGRVTFWGEIDHQHTLPSGTPEEVRKAVLRLRKALDFGSGGVIAQCRWGMDTPIRNIAAAFDQWMLPLPMHVV